MRALARHGTLVALSALLSWWLFLRAPLEPPPGPDSPQEEPPPLALLPRLRAPVASEVPPSDPPAPELEEPEPEAPEPSEPAPDAPPPPELGTPGGDEEGAADPETPAEERDPEPPDADGEEAEPTEPESASAEELMADSTLLEAAREELEGAVREGFATVLLAAPEDQVEIARFFGEELVLVPRAALDPEADDARWWRLAPGPPERVEEVRERPPLDRYRQYRDLFDYDYSRLPEPLRDLRRRVVARSDVYLFAALLPRPEWAVVVGRRREALARAGRELEEVQRFVLRYVRRAGGGFDVRVEEIVFADGTRFRPSPDREGSSPP